MLEREWDVTECVCENERRFWGLKSKQVNPVHLHLHHRRCRWIHGLLIPEKIYISHFPRKCSYFSASGNNNNCNNSKFKYFNFSKFMLICAEVPSPSFSWPHLQSGPSRDHTFNLDRWFLLFATMRQNVSVTATVQPAEAPKSYIMLFKRHAHVLVL